MVTANVAWWSFEKWFIVGPKALRWFERARMDEFVGPTCGVKNNDWHSV